MADDIAIRVENLSKRYRIGAKEEVYDTFAGMLSDWVKRPGQNMRRLRGLTSFSENGQEPEDIIWALKDVYFEVKRGEVVGIIGRNGAGKSTLLKILSRITHPTSGRVELNGRVSSLLEVGTGFHPELTGRENIYLNGTILGMRKVEIDRRFDQIVHFSGIEKFIDTPVKRYSSGMRVRLAFSVAAHLEPEILLVDEVLAVGDVEFQKKCLGKMGEVASKGRTVIFVSHNMAAIKALCSRAFYIKNGYLSLDSDVHSVIDTYTGAGFSRAEAGAIVDDAQRLYSTGLAKFQTIQLHNSLDESSTQLYLGESFRVVMTLDVVSEIKEAAIEVTIVSAEGTQIASARTLDGDDLPITIPSGKHEIMVEMNVFLLPQNYYFLLIIHQFSGEIIDWVERALDFTVLNVARDNSDSYRYWPIMRGHVRAQSRWILPNSNSAIVMNAS